MNKPSLSARRAQLVERCAEQRTSLAYELNALRPSNALGHPVAGFVVANKKLVLGVLGGALALAVTRPKRLLRLAGSAVSGLKMAQGALGLLSRYRQ